MNRLLLAVALSALAVSPAVAQGHGPKKAFLVEPSHALSVTRDVLVHQGFEIVRVEQSGNDQVVYYRAANKGKGHVKPASFIDIAHLEEVNASVDAMRASLLGSAASEPTSSVKHPAVQLLYQVAHANHEISVVEATQLFELAKALEEFWGKLAPIGRNLRR